MFNSSSAFIQKILAGFDIYCQIDLVDTVRHLVNDSRDVKANDIFCAVQGSEQSGAVYIKQAISKGCDLVLVECDSQNLHGKITEVRSGIKTIKQIQFYQLNQQLFNLSKAFYQSPQSQLKMIGITGTNGKTTTSQLIAKLLTASQQRCAVIGTNGAGEIDNLTPIANTTPGASQLHQLLQSFNTNNTQVVAMEVSSHALAQGRVIASLFDIAVFTNLTRDHLDYHQNMASYAAAKYQLFSQKQSQQAVVNGDDKQAQKWLKNWSKEQDVLVYGRSAQINQYDRFVQAIDIKHHQSGVSFTLKTEQGTVKMQSPLFGDFNIDNLLAAISVLIIQGFSLDKIAEAVFSLSPIAGRMEMFTAWKKATAIVDYAHTPDALENALKACRQHCTGELWLVFGCGGDRDQGKRAQMGLIAEQHSDHVILTNDNPRSENPSSIVNDILSGCQQPDKIAVLLERQQAVLAALKKVKATDVVLLAGKGHEDYIIVGNEYISYNERELVRSIYAGYAHEEKS